MASSEDDGGVGSISSDCSASHRVSVNTSSGRGSEEEVRWNSTDVINLSQQMPTLLMAMSPVIRNHASPSLESCKSPFFLANASPSLESCKSPFLGAHAAPFLEPCKSPVLGTHACPSMRCHEHEDECVIPGMLVRSEIDTSRHSEEVSAAPPAAHDQCRKADDAAKAAPKHTSRSMSAKGHEFIVDVDPSSAETQACERLQLLLRLTQELWTDPTVAFGSNCVDLLAKHSEMKLTILVRTESSLEEARGCSLMSSLIGFLVYNVNPKTKCMSIRRLAIAPDFRKQGYASVFMDWCVRRPNVRYLAATSLPDAVGFYRAYGFRKVETWHTGGTARPDDPPTLGSNQVYMEYHPSKSKARRRGNRK